ncbi:nuclear transport factor 2 family protein [Microbacterium sp.]|uniref:nuclear transport factor 2 family protein n=1 Tax=Microbacterium sp. TaxID=51671 RepID=UPI003C7434BF
MTIEPRTIVTGYLNAVAAHDSDRLRALLHEDAEFRNGPARVTGRDAYVAAFERIYPAVERNDIRHIFVDGDLACAVYDFITPTSVGAVLTMELLRIEDGLIRSSELLFDLRRWPDVTAELSART